MSKKVITRLTHHLSFRDLVVGLGILVTILLIYWMREGRWSVFLDNNVFKTLLTEQRDFIIKIVKQTISLDQTSWIP